MYFSGKLRVPAVTQGTAKNAARDALGYINIYTHVTGNNCSQVCITVFPRLRAGVRLVLNERRVKSDCFPNVRSKK